MQIDLKPEQQRIIEFALKSGAYVDSADVIDQAFEFIREQLHFEDWMSEQRDSIAAHVERGFAQAERGELMDGDRAIEMLRLRRIERLNRQV
jgi:Arc/MetJ-type ribon-helix-helix transcriptional regulator